MRAYLLQFLLAIGLGIFVGVTALFRELLLPTSVGSGRKRVRLGLELFFDIILYLYIGVCYALFSYATCDGVLRWFSAAISVLIGLFTFHYMRAPAMRAKAFVLGFIVKISVWIKIQIISPVFRAIYLVLHTFFAPIQAFFSIIGNSIKRAKMLSYHKRKFKHKKTAELSFLTKI